MIPTRLTKIALFSIGFMLFVAQPAASQVEFGGNVSVTDVRGGTGGLAARVGVVTMRSPGTVALLEGVVDWFFPDCPGIECNAAGAQLNLLVERASRGPYQLYGGAGAIYQSLTLLQEDTDLEPFDGHVWGFNIIIGSRFTPGKKVQPFAQFRFSFLDGINNQGAVELGVRIVPSLP